MHARGLLLVPVPEVATKQQIKPQLNHSLIKTDVAFVASLRPIPGGVKLTARPKGLHHQETDRWGE